MWQLSLDVLRSYVNVDTHFRLKDDGTWCGIYKDYPFDFEDNEESLKKVLTEKIEKSKLIPEFSPSEMEANALTYDYTMEDKVYLSNLFSDCKLKAQKQRQESLDKVGYKEELDRKKLTEIYNLTTVNEVYTVLSEYVGYLIVDSTLKVKVKLNFPFNQKSEEVMRTLDLFNLEEFIHYLELANEYYKENMSYVSFIALRSFNEKIKERFPTLQFRTSYDIPYYRKEIS